MIYRKQMSIQLIDKTTHNMCDTFYSLFTAYTQSPPVNSSLRYNCNQVVKFIFKILNFAAAFRLANI